MDWLEKPGGGSHKFGRSPTLVNIDQRLKDRERRVLTALCSFANVSGWCNPSRETIAIHAGLKQADDISRITSSLEKLGWLKKVVFMNANKPNEYRLTVPEEAIAQADAVLLKSNSTDKDSDVATVEIQQEGTVEIQQEGTVEIQQTNIPVNKPVEQTIKFNASKFLEDCGADKALVRDWFIVRKDKKASQTETALKRFMAEVEKSGLGINEVLTICIERSWKGFDATWLKNIGSSANGSPMPDKRTATDKFFDAIGDADLTQYEPRVASVVTYWKGTLKTGGSANKDACDLIVKRLAEVDRDFNFGEFVLKDCIDACLKSEYHMNRNFTRLNDILSDKNFADFVKKGYRLTTRSQREWELAANLRHTGGIVIEGQAKRVDSNLIEQVPF